MARKSRSRRKSGYSAYYSRAIWIVWSLVTGGSVAGWLAPTLPIVGPIMQKVLNSDQVTEALDQVPDEALRSNLKRLRTDLAQKIPTSASPVSGSTATGFTPPSVGSPSVTPPQSAMGSGMTTATAAGANGAVQKPGDAIRIASYNIQVFGEAKLAKPQVVDILAKVVRHFDIVAIQEVRAKGDTILPRFVAAINADGSRFDFVIGPRLGRTVSTEQYAYVFDTNRIEVDRNSVGTMSDPNDLLHREPLVARFRTRAYSATAPFSFWLVNSHTDPDEAKEEVNVLAGAFQAMLTARPDEDDVILLGDLNVSELQLGQLAQVPGIMYVVAGTPTNTRRNRTYDHILFSRFTTTEYTGRWGVVDIQNVFGLTMDQALEVSDHFPVWAEFRIWESPQAANTALLPGFYRQ
jgi:deoxyribonuclease-1-like protein